MNPPLRRITSGCTDTTGPSHMCPAIGTALCLGKSFRQRVTVQNDARSISLADRLEPSKKRQRSLEAGVLEAGNLD